MIIIIIILVLGLFFGIAILLVTGAVASQSWAKKQAKAMLDKGKVDPEKVSRVLKVLSATQDNEGKRLYGKLADLAEKERI